MNYKRKNYSIKKLNITIFITLITQFFFKKSYHLRVLKSTPETLVNIFLKSVSFHV